jgi:hypothetical protein
MNNKVNNNNIFKCNICNKLYSSKSSLCNHNKKFHSINNNLNIIPNIINNNLNIIPNIINNNLNIIPNIINKKYPCRYCNTDFTQFQNRWRHQKKCKLEYKAKNKEIEDINNKKLELEIIKENNIRLKEETKILQLKLKLEKSNKIDNITLKKLNKMLIERNTRIKNSNNTINSNNQQIINNFQLIGFGKEEVMEKLSNHDKKLIMNAKYNSLDKLIEIIHCGKYSQFKNIIVTNMKDNYMYKYDDKVGHFVLSTKSDVLNSLIDYRLEDLETIYHDLLDKNKLDENTKDIIEKFINKINYVDTKYTDYEGKEHDNYKQFKINEIKVLLFNNQNKITNDISLLLTTNEVTNDLVI